MQPELQDDRIRDKADRAIENLIEAGRMTKAGETPALPVIVRSLVESRVLPA